MYLWNLGASGTADSFYAAAVQAGTKSWKASGRIFGFNSWSMLVPQALEGVAAVALLYAAVRRWSGPAAGLDGTGETSVCGRGARGTQPPEAEWAA